MASENNKEDSFVKWGIAFSIFIFLIAGCVFYDDVYSDGRTTTIKSKIERLIGISPKKVVPHKRDSIK